MCAPDRRRLVPLATLAAVAPALMLMVEHRMTGTALGLAADVWKGAATGATLGLHIAAVTVLLRGRRDAGGWRADP